MTPLAASQYRAPKSEPATIILADGGPLGQLVKFRNSESQLPQGINSFTSFTVVQPAPKTAKKESWVKSREEIEAEEVATGAVASYQGSYSIDIHFGLKAVSWYIFGAFSLDIEGL